MKSINLTKEIYDWIDKECDDFMNRTWTGNDVGVNDILYTFLHSSDDVIYILNDWNEGMSADPFWNKELNEHSAIVFIKDMCERLDRREYED